MPTEKYDVAIIGAGLGGLSAATYLTKAGYRVVLLEHYVVPGGYAHEFTRGYYSFDVSLRHLDGIAPGTLSYTTMAELGLSQAITFNRLDPIYTAAFPDHTITAHADSVAYEAELVRHFPHERTGLRQLIDTMIQVFYDMRRYRSDIAAGLCSPDEPIPESYPRLHHALQQTWSDFMQRYISDPQLQAIFSVLWNYQGLPPARLSAATFILRWVSLHVFGAYYPQEGVMTMSWALARTVRNAGGQLHYRQTVTNIAMHDGLAATIETDKGLQIEADVVISNANPPDTLLNLVGREHLPDPYAQELESLQPALSSLVVFLGLDRDLLAEGWNHHEYMLCPGYDPDTAYQAVLNGDYQHTDMSITYYNPHYPTCAPKGGSVVTLYSLAAWDYANQWGTEGDQTSYQKNARYLELKQQVFDALLTRAETLLPNLRSTILYQEVASPMTNMRYSLNRGGSFSGAEQTVDNTFDNRLTAHTPIPNLFLTGAWVSAGSISSVLVSGRDTANLARAYLNGTNAPPTTR